jgi:DNA-binding transcriptional MerR regulator
MAGSEGTTGSQGRAGGRDRSRSTRRRGARGSAPAPATQGELLPEGKLYYRIGEVARITGVKPHVLRYWETEFRWMSPPKSRSKQRLYRRKDIEMILVIKRLLYEERYTIAGARQQLRELGLAKALETAVDAPPAERPGGEAAVPQSSAEAVSELQNGYRRIRRELQALREML